MDPTERRLADRRRVPRGGRRAPDVPGRYPAVLVADRDDSVRRVFVQCLHRLGFQVEEAATTDAAVAIVELCHPRIAIAELTLPGDHEFQASVRAHHIPYIVTATKDGVVPPDAAAVLMKPFPLAVLLKEVRRALRGPEALTKKDS